MGRLFLFGIGGTGSRVIKSLTFLLAAGAKLNADKVIPIIVDPDRENGDLNRTLEILRLYTRIRQEAASEHSDFFRTNIQSLREMAEEDKEERSQLSNGYKSEIDGTREGLFRDFIDYDNLLPSSQKMMDLLFGQRSLNESLEVGFKGHPNMGSVVLNQYKNSGDFRYFAQNYRPEDRIFIISSIFGGTGSAGFPLLVENIRQPEVSGLSNVRDMKEAKIGAITLLPYFGVEENRESAINKSTFAGKARAALRYYENNLNRKLNALYYIGDERHKDYPNREGRSEQKNDAHYVELVSALAVLNFMNIPDHKFGTKGSHAKETSFREFGLRGDNPTSLNFEHFRNRESEMFEPLIRFAYATKYWREHLNSAVDQQAWSKGSGSRGSIALDRVFFGGDFYRNDLMQFVNRWNEWLTELARNDRPFSPFRFDVRGLHDFISNVTQKSTGWFGGKPDWDFSNYDEHLNKAERHTNEQTPERKFMALFSKATEDIVEKRIP